MSDHESHDQLEAALRQLTPTPPAFEKERVVFLAGQASGRRARWRLALLAAILGIGSGIAGTYWGVRAFTPSDVPPQVVVIHVPVPAAVPEAPEVPKQQEPHSPPSTEDRSLTPVWDSVFQFPMPAVGYMQLRHQALRWGVETLPTAAPTATGGPMPRPTNVLDMQSRMIGRASEL